MGQKVSPISLRLSLNPDLYWSTWWANKKEFGLFLCEDHRIREFLARHLGEGAAISRILIRRMEGKVEITICTARPGVVIGKKGAEIGNLKKKLEQITGKEVWVEVSEIKRPGVDPRLVAQGIAKQLQKRVSFRRAMKKAIQLCKDAGVCGVKIKVAGRLNGAEIAREECYHEGRIGLHTLRHNVDYGAVAANTVYGVIGVQVWINKEGEMVEEESKKREEKEST